jgi:hypothetical protein
MAYLGMAGSMQGRGLQFILYTNVYFECSVVLLYSRKHGHTLFSVHCKDDPDEDIMICCM